MYFRTICLSVLTLIVTGCSRPAPSSAEAQEAPDKFVALTRTAYANGRLWLLDDSGVLFSLSETERVARKEPLPEKALDVCIRDGRVIALTGNAAGKTVTLRELSWGHWHGIGTIADRESNLSLLACSSQSILIAGGQHVIKVENDMQTDIALKTAISGSVAYRLSDQLYIGVNHGEWGGGLHRVDLRDGSVTTLGGAIKEPPCGGLLNAECEVVTGIVEMPGAPDCLAVASGLMHMSGSGSLYRVCGDKVSRLYDKRYHPSDVSDPDVYDTMPFLNLFRRGDILWATTAFDGVYAVSADGQARQQPVSGFRKVAPFDVSFAVPGIVVVRTDYYKRYAYPHSDSETIYLVTAR